MLLSCDFVDSFVRSVLFFFKHKTSYEMRISDWSSDVFSSDLQRDRVMSARLQPHIIYVWNSLGLWHAQAFDEGSLDPSVVYTSTDRPDVLQQAGYDRSVDETIIIDALPDKPRSEEHTTELKSLMRISYAVFCLNKKTKN